MGHAYETIVAWQKADDLAVEVFRVTSQFPKSEMYGLTSQMRRAAVSIAANIAEGAARQYYERIPAILVHSQVLPGRGSLLYSSGLPSGVD